MGFGSMFSAGSISRPPRGGRGLKCPVDGALVFACGRPPRGGRGLKLACEKIKRQYERVVLLAEDVD